MNNSRRKRINASINDLKEAQIKLEQVLNEERIAQENLPLDDEYNDMRDGMDDIISGLEDTLSCLEDSLSTLDGCDF